MADGCYLRAQPQINTRLGQIGAEHGNDLARRAVAEQLPKGFFMPRNARAIYPRNEIMLRIARQGRARETGVFGKETVGPYIQIGEIAPPPARDADFLARCFGMVYQRHAAAPAACLYRAKQAGRACAQDDHIIPRHARGPRVAQPPAPCGHALPRGPAARKITARARAGRGPKAGRSPRKGPLLHITALARPHRGIAPTFGQKHVMPAFFGNAPVFQHDNAVCIHHSR